MIIAVDGPAASGKGTIARALARHYRLPHLDTGLLYRAVATRVLRDGMDPTREADCVAACDFPDSLLYDPWLRTDEAGQTASIVSAHPLVRSALLRRQRKFAQQPGGAVLDGRDIGTVVCPQARVKLFIIAAPEERARRRHRELLGRGEETTLAAILADIRARDARDSSRAAAPLKAAEDAVVLDTTELDAEAAFAEAVSIVERLKAA